jgi:hypothetical protein
MDVRKATSRVVFGYCSPQDVKTDFMESLLYTVLYDFAGPKRLIEGGGLLPVRAGVNLSGPRNEMVKKFLAFGKAEWLLMVDSDMVFMPDLVEKLLRNADPETAPIVGGLCFGFDEKGEVQPTLYGFVGGPDDPQVVRYHEWPPDTMMQVAATGAAALLVHRGVFERMRDFQHPSRPGKLGFNDAYPWFQELEHNGRPVSEDIGFCWRAGLLGIPIYVDTSVQIGHVKQRVLTMDSYLISKGLLSPEVEK